MSLIVIDCSITMAWCFEDEHNEYAQAVFDALEVDDAAAPALWPFEVVNVLAGSSARPH